MKILAETGAISAKILVQDRSLKISDRKILISDGAEIGNFRWEKCQHEKRSKWRTIKSLVDKTRLHGRRGKVTAESLSRDTLRQAPQKEGG